MVTGVIDNGTFGYVAQTNLNCSSFTKAAEVVTILSVTGYVNENNQYFRKRIADQIFNNSVFFMFSKISKNMVELNT